MPGTVAAKVHAHAEDAAAQPQPRDVKKEANDRKNAAIAARIQGRDKAEVESAEVATESEAPKARPSTAKAAGEAPRPTGSAESGSKTAATESGTPGTDGSETAEQTAEKEQRYELKSLRTWARKNPEVAAEFVESLGVAKEQTTEWIRVQNKLRKRTGQLDEREKSISESETAARAAAKDTVDTLTPIANLFEAVNPDRGTEGGKFDPKKIDFDAADQAWHDLTGVPIDEYMRHRARKGVAVNPEMRALKLENERLKKQLAPSKEEAKEEAKPNGKAKAAEPEAPSHWESEIGEDHGLRQFAGWQRDLTKAMAPFYDPDLDEYSKDVEAVADKLLLRKVKEFEFEEEEEEVKAKPKPRPVVAAKPKPKVADVDGIPADAFAFNRQKPKNADVNGHDAELPKDFAARKRLALERHEQRRRGQLDD